MTATKECHVPGAVNPTASISRLNACLVEVDAHLGGAGPYCAPVPVSAFMRIKLALAILEHEAEPPLTEALTDLAGTIEQIHQALISVPERCDPRLNPAWEHLAGFLARMLDGLDAGRTLADLAGDPGWEDAAGRLERATGPAGVMDALSDTLADWRAFWDRGALDRDMARRLHERWLRLRDEGDRQFGRDLLDSFGTRPGKNR